MKTAMEDSKRNNPAAIFKKKKVSKRRGADETKSL